VKNRIDGAVLRQLSTLFNLGVIRELTDGQLLERFSTGGGEVAELAFAALVERHGAMVMRVCRALLANPHDTQDAFQATFLVLVRKARALWVRDSLGPWLHQVAFRTASSVRSDADRRRKHERRAAESAAYRDGYEDQTGSEWGRVLHEEIDQLPERYRVPIVLCDLEGHTCEEAARRMGRPVGTVKSWRSRGHERLRGRLSRRGLAPSAGLGAALAAGVAQASVPKPGAEETARVVVRAAADWMTAGKVSPSVRKLVDGVIKAMVLCKLRTSAIAVFWLAILVAGIGTVPRVGARDSQKPGDEAQGEVPRPAYARQRRPNSPTFKESREFWSLSLPEVIRLGLGNCDGVRVIEPDVNRVPDGTYVIARKYADAGAQRFKASVMADVRSIEQQYWSLAQQHVELWGKERAVGLAEEVLKHEQADLEAGRGASVADAQQRLEQYRLDLVKKTSDVITTERQLRKLLGLPSADDRQIVPVSAPIEALLEPDWETCKAAMLDKHPDVLWAKLEVEGADVARDGLAKFERQKAYLQAVIHRTTHSLARCFLEIDANYQQFKSASQLRASAAQRLEAQRVFYEEGRITADRYLDVVSEYARAVAQEAQFKTSYNIAIVALEEAKGTLLEYDKITVVDYRPTPAADSSRDSGAQPASHEFPASIVPPVSLDTTVSRAKCVENDEGPKAELAGKSFSFQLTVGRGSKPIEIRGSFTVTPVRSVDASKAR
jgi:RNA polymerase sigma factor (sigma-70 family)